MVPRITSKTCAISAEGSPCLVWLAGSRRDRSRGGRIARRGRVAMDSDLVRKCPVSVITLRLNAEICRGHGHISGQVFQSATRPFRPISDRLYTHFVFERQGCPPENKACTHTLFSNAMVHV